MLKVDVRISHRHVQTSVGKEQWESYAGTKSFDSIAIPILLPSELVDLLYILYPSHHIDPRILLVYLGLTTDVVSDPPST
jgi:hypothetical protein